MEDRVMVFFEGLAPVLEQRAAMLLAQTTIPSLEEAVSAMIQEESRIMLQAGAGGLPGVKSALAVSNPGAGPRGETRECYNCGEIGHLKQACKKPLKDRNSGGRGQPGGRGRGRCGRRGGRGGYQEHMTVAEGDDDGSVTGVGFSEEDQAFLDVLLTRKQKAGGDGKSVVDVASNSSSSRGNFASFAHSAIGTCDTLALASISTTRYHTPRPRIATIPRHKHITPCTLTRRFTIQSSIKYETSS